MNCNDVAAILDSNRGAHMTAAERATVDVHLSTCEDCDAAWHAQTELMALRVPAMPATLLERALGAARMPPVAQPRRALRPIAIGVTLLAGAALASMTIVSLTDSPSAGIPPSADGEPSAQVDEALVDTAPAAVTRATATPDLATSVELVETSDADVIPLVRHNPQYPPEALAERANGDVQLKFDISAAGAVENVSVVKSNDARFEQSAVDALANWRYLPRLVAGKRVGRDGVQTIIRFVLEGAKDAPAAPTPRQQEEIDATIREGLAYSAGLEVALDRLAADDLRGVELQLDEMQAVYGAERLDLWNFYGYLYTVEGNYSRAIDAYETAVVVAMRSPYPTAGPYVSLATHYFARHPSDMALKTLLRPQQVMGSAADGRPRRVSNEAAALIERLRALGVTEESLIGR
jgi:TonB family protein